MKVRCNACGNVFDEKDLIYDGEDDMDYCPECGEDGNSLEDLPKEKFPQYYTEDLKN